MNKKQHIIILSIIFVSSLLYFKESLIWFYKVLTGLHDLFNTVLFFLLVFFISKNISLKKESIYFTYSLTPFFISCAAVIGYYISESFININTLSFIFLLIYLFGFLGFFISKQKWLAYVVPLCLLIMVLPFGNILDLYIGFPLRMTSVKLVSIFFENLNIDFVSIDTIITIENSSSQVDFSCSGIKGLWAALLFYFTNTWLKKYKINVNWFLIGGALLFLILLFNTLRILILVYFDLVLKLPTFSNIIHVPLGIFGFVFSCVITYFLSEKLLKSKPQTSSKEITKKQAFSFNKAFIIIPVLQIVLFFNSKETTSNVIIKHHTKQFDTNFTALWNINKTNVSEEESKFITLTGGDLQKFSFFNKNLKGNGFFLKSKTWRSHHNPEFCITAGGKKIIQSETLKTGSNSTIKKIILDTKEQGYYWFQNNTYTTDDFGTRVWNEIFKQQKDWFLICIIFNADDATDQKEKFIKNITTQINH